MFKFRRYHLKMIIIEAIFTILLVLMFQYIMGQRIYYDISQEPVKSDDTRTINGDSTYIQEMACEKDFLQGITVLAYSDTGEDGKLFVQIYDDKGEQLAEASQRIAEEGYTAILFDETIEGCREKNLKVVFRTDAMNQIILQGSEEDNVCVQFIYRMLDVRKYKLLVYLIGGILWIILSFFLVLLQLKTQKQEYIFLFLYFILGIMYMVIIPISATPDEGAHFMRIYGISEGAFVAECDVEKGTAGSELPDHLLQGFKSDKMKLPDLIEGKDLLLSKDKKFVSYSASALYSPFTYTAQVIGVTIGKIITNKVFLIAYCGRIAAWLVVGCILFLSIKYIPFGKNILMAISLLPMNMHESISLAGDSFTFAVTSAFISYVFYQRERKKESIFGWKDYAVLYILLFYVASCKIVYVPLCILAVLIPAERFGDRKKYIKVIIISVLEVILTSGIWMYISMNILNGSLGGKSQEQIVYVLENPLRYVAAVVNTTITYAEGFVKGMIGASLGWFSVSINFGIIAMIFINFVYICVQENNDCHDEKRGGKCGILMFASMSVVILIYTSLYVQWTELGSNIIHGIQGRYFIPILLPFILSMKYGKRTLGNSDYRKNDFMVSYLILLITNIFTLVSLLTYFII